MSLEKKITLFEAYYSDCQKKSLDPGFELYDSREINEHLYREVPIFKKFCLTSSWSGSEYSGLFSPRFTEKTGLTSDHIRDFIYSKPGADIYLFHPFKYELAVSSDFMQLAELEHPGIKGELNNIWREIFSQNLPIVDSRNDFNLCCHCNYFVANKSFWGEYSKFILEFSQNWLKSDLTQYSLAKDGMLNLPMSVFMFERALTHYLKDHTEFAVENYSAHSDWEQIELFKGEKLFCDELIAKILKSPETERSELFDLATKAYYFYRRVMVG